MKDKGGPSPTPICIAAEALLISSEAKKGSSLSGAPSSFSGPLIPCSVHSGGPSSTSGAPCGIWGGPSEGGLWFPSGLKGGLLS